jgi:phosphate transport system substrate-binding protein
MDTTPSRSNRRSTPNLRVFALCASLLVVVSFGLCTGSAGAQNGVVLVGSGSSVPAPLYTRWAQEFGKDNASIQMRYLPVGTSEGIKQISHGAGDFAAGEAQLTESQRKEGGLIELPLVLIAIVPIYNLPELHQELRLSGEVLAGIYLGEIKTWNAPQIAKLNPDASLPNMNIQVVIRPAGKGSNYVFTEFLSKASPKFRSQIGVGASPKWPEGQAAERSSDMVDKVKNTPGAIGYVEYQYAVKNGIPQAAILNPAGRFVKASPASIDAACQAVEAPQWNRFAASLTNAAGADSFPITSFSWLYLRLKSADSARGAALSDLLNWIYADGQHFASQEGYSELPAPLLAAVKRKVTELH